MKKIKDIVGDEAALLLLKQHLKNYGNALHTKKIAVNSYKVEAVAQAVQDIGIDASTFDALVKAEVDGNGEAKTAKARAKALALAFYHDYPLFELLEGDDRE